MAEAVLVRPDRKVVEDIIAAGGGDLKRCMQCANCSVVCELSDGEGPFPRKEMVWAQWGLEDRLVSDPDIWMCHQCNDCSARCPRGARPGDVLAALRRHAVQFYAIPRFLARWVNDARMLPVTLLIPVVLLALAVVARDPIAGALGLEAEHELYAAFFPHWMLIGLFGSLTTLTFVLALVSLARFWGAMSAADREAGVYRAAAGVVASFALALKSILTHDRFGFCEAQAPRRLSHLAVFYGFLALFVVTVWATIDLYLNPVLGIEARYPFGLLHPMKLLANVGGVALVFGAVRVVRSRLEDTRGTPTSTAFDWTLVWVVLGVGLTGFVAEIFRFTIAPDSGLRTVAWSFYFVHLVLVFQLLVYLPYSKLAHLLYRTVAMAYAERTGRYRPVRRRSAGSAALAATPAGPALGAGGS